MGNPSTIFMLFLALLAISAAATGTTLSEKTRSLNKWFKTTLDQENETLTKLHIYIHANFANAPGQTVYEVASADITKSSRSHFGWILVIDNPITIGPGRDSESLGRYQGTNVYSDFREPAANMNMNMVFTAGEYNGSTISIQGRQPVSEEYRVLIIVGGTGVFGFAKGIVVASTYSTDPAAQTGTYLYDMYVVTQAAKAFGGASREAWVV